MFQRSVRWKDPDGMMGNCLTKKGVLLRNALGDSICYSKVSHKGYLTQGFKAKPALASRMFFSKRMISPSCCAKRIL